MKPLDIIDHVCKVLELDKDLLIGKQRGNCPTCQCKMRIEVDSTPKYRDGRTIICYLLHQHHPNLKYHEIGTLIGRILQNGFGDHSFVVYAEKKCRLEKDKKHKAFSAKFEKCQNSIKSVVSPMAI